MFERQPPFFSGHTCTSTDLLLGDLGPKFPRTVNMQAFLLKVEVASVPVISGDDSSSNSARV